MAALGTVFIVIATLVTTNYMPTEFAVLAVLLGGIGGFLHGIDY